MSVSANEIWRAIYDRVVGLIKAVGAGSGFPGGSDTELQYNNDGSFDGTAGMEWDAATQQMGFTGDARFEKTINLPVYSMFAAYLHALDIGYGGITSLEIPLDWDPSTDMTLKFRWFCDEAYATNNGEVNYDFIYNAVAIGEVAAEGTSQSSGDINIPATAAMIAETTWGIDHADLEAGDSLVLQIWRAALDDGNDPVSLIAVLSVTLKYTANRWGNPV